jgi:hypothetical protein
MLWSRELLRDSASAKICFPQTCLTLPAQKLGGLNIFYFPVPLKTQSAILLAPSFIINNKHSLDIWPTYFWFVACRRWVSNIILPKPCRRLYNSYNSRKCCRWLHPVHTVRIRLCRDVTTFLIQTNDICLQFSTSSQIFITLRLIIKNGYTGSQLSTAQ